MPCASIPPLLIGLDALVGLGETTTPPVVWTCRARRHVAFPPPAAIAILSFPSAEGKGVTHSLRGRGRGDGLRVPRSRYGPTAQLLHAACFRLGVLFFVRQTCCPCIQQAQPTPAVCRALSPCFCSRCPQSAEPSCAPPVAAVVPLLQAPAPVHTG